MSFLKVIKPLLGTAAAFQVHLACKDGILSLLLLPQLAPAEEDEDAGLAAFRAVLARPVKVEVPADADPDTYVVAALNDLATVRGEAVSELDAYRAALTAAKDEAKAADEARRAEASKKTNTAKTTAKPAKAATSPSKASKPTAAAPTVASSAETQDTDGDADEAETETATSAPVAAESAAPPPSAGQSNLFASIGL